jgi:hypothetical protein
LLRRSYLSVSTIPISLTCTFDRAAIFSIRGTLTKRTGVLRTTVFSLKLYWRSPGYQRQDGRIAPEILATIAMLSTAAGRHYCLMVTLV